METLTEIGALLLIAHTCWFVRCYRENKRRVTRRLQTALDFYILLEGQE
jgi:hypothetical protein